MAIKASDYVWHNGQLVPWDDAKIHVMAHVINYGSSVFEGIRCYQNGKGPAIFRLRDHMLRLLQSCKIYRIELDYTLDDLCQALTGARRGFREGFRVLAGPSMPRSLPAARRTTAW